MRQRALSVDSDTPLPLYLKSRTLTLCLRYIRYVTMGKTSKTFLSLISGK